MWAFRVFPIFILFTWVLSLLSCFKFGGNSTKKTKNRFFEVARKKRLSESVSLNEVNLQNSEVSDQPLENTSTQEVLFNFFFPTTCMIKEIQEVTPCNELLNLTEAACSKSKGCFSTSLTRNCFVPLRDESTQVARIFGLSVFSLFFLGSMLLYCCCSVWERSQFVNPL
ncbi:fragile X mental retardation 1 neighbor protein-like [Heterocephalus glaber]|uniref:Fragile X mental retardation 1 neighbor protein-like n=1 Tax=Heterocephalus glaber TaxID=10181 RepID=A0AAX6R901_HETGA|nr:fragile X mental retardation 1 neighbor protein-like [Heterocephalus glaber]